jgi:hypothetical protein
MVRRVRWDGGPHVLRGGSDRPLVQPWRAVAGARRGHLAVPVHRSGRRTGGRLDCRLPAWQAIWRAPEPCGHPELWIRGMVHPHDLAGYVAAQLAGATTGVAIARLILGSKVASPAVNYGVAHPGHGWGDLRAGIGEAILTAVLIAALPILAAGGLGVDHAVVAGPPDRARPAGLRMPTRSWSRPPPAVGQRGRHKPGGHLRCRWKGHSRSYGRMAP